MIGKTALFEPVCETEGSRSRFVEILSEAELQQKINMPIEAEEDDDADDDFY